MADSKKQSDKSSNFGSGIAAGLLGSLGSSVLSGITSLFNHSSQKRENERNRNFAREMFDKQVQNNIKMWNMQNEYDLPVNQIERMRQAGLNPDLMYTGAGVSSSPNLQSVSPSGYSSGFSPVDFGNFNPLVAAQIDLLKAQARNLDVDSEKKDSEKNILDIDAKSLVARNDAALENLKANTENLDANSKKVLEGELPHLKKGIDHFNALISNLNQDTSNKNAENLKIFFEGQEQMLRYQLTQKELKWFDSKAYVSMQLDLSAMGLNDAQAAHLQQQIDTYFESFSAEMDKLKSETDHVRTQAFAAAVQTKLLEPLFTAMTEHPESFKNAAVIKAWTEVIGSLLSSASSIIAVAPK